MTVHECIKTLEQLKRKGRAVKVRVGVNEPPVDIERIELSIGYEAVIITGSAAKAKEAA